MKISVMRFFIEWGSLPVNTHFNQSWSIQCIFGSIHVKKSILEGKCVIFFSKNGITLSGNISDGEDLRDYHVLKEDLMKKRVLSLFLAFVLSFSMMPMSAFAEEAGTVTEQETQNSENTADVSTTGEETTGEETVEVSTTGEDISGGNAVTKDAAVEAAQALINALPEEVTADNADELQAQLMAIDKALEALNDEQRAELDMTRLENICAALNGLVAVQDTHDHGTMTPWKDANSLPNDGKSYYLDTDVTLTGKWYPANDTVLCLNGHSIIMQNKDDPVISINSGVTFTLYDCNGSGKGNGKITHSDNGGHYGRGVYIKGGIFNMHGGTISHNYADGAAGVFVYSGSFTMTGGTISDNTTSTDLDYHAGGVEVGNGATFTMTGGEITGNKAFSGGGVYVKENGTFSMTGGKITGNILYKSDEANKHDGDDTENGAGVYVKGNSIFEVAGNVQIEGNKDASGKIKNVYLGTKDTTITVTGELADGANIGVTTATSLGESDFVTIAKGASESDMLTETDRAAFSSDADAGYTVSLKNNTIIFANGELHEHAICGVGNCSDNHTSEQWKPITSLDDIKGEGYYYLKNDVIVSATWNCKYDVKLCLNGNTITGKSGDVIYVENSLDITDCGGNGNGKITLSDGVKGRGISVGYGGALTLWNGNITGITPPDAYKATGSGVYVAYNGQFTMRGGAITGNTSGNLGGGVYVAGTFIMSDGEITGNTSTSHGGGVYVSSYSTFTMTGGKIIGNNTTTTNTDGYSAGGVYVDPTGSFIVSGNAQIRNNYWNGTLDANKVYVDGKNSNVLLLGSGSRLATITIGENGLKPEAKIGVGRNADSFDESNKAKIATGAKDTSLNYAAIFTSDDPQYVITNEQGILYLGVHQHNWNYTPSAEDKTTINAACTATGCSAADGKGGSVTIAALDKLTYDGSPKAATVSASTDWMGEAVENIPITYENEDGNKSSTAPTNAGKYTASITLGGATAGVTYEIAKATPTAGDFTFAAPSGGLIYDGNAQLATVVAKDGIEGMSDNITRKYYQDGKEVPEPKNAGTYTVKIDVAEGENYTAANGVTDSTWNFTIQRNPNAPVVVLNDGTTYTYTGKQIRPDVTVKLGIWTLVEGKDYTVTYGENKNVGTGTVTITATKDGNYDFKADTLTFTIEQAEQTVSFAREEVTDKTYSDRNVPFTNQLTHVGDGEVTYSSSDTNVATVNNTTGEVTIVGVGKTTITATAAATQNYKEGTASYTLTVNKAPVHIVQASVADKVYDGKPKADVTGVVLADKAGVEIGGLIVGTDYTVIGAFQSENAGVQDAEVRVKLLGDFDAHYELTSETYMTRATISAKPVSIATVTTENRSYKRNDTSVTITGVTFNDADGKPVTTLTSSDYKVSGKMADANIGTDKEVTVTVTLQGDAANNYSLAPNTTTAKVTISKAAGGALTGDNFQQKFSDLRQKTFTPDYTGLPAGEAWKYSISGAQTSGSAKVEAVKIDAAGEITYTLTDGAAGDTVSWTVTISNDNYEDFTKDLVLTLTEKDPQEPLRITGDDTVVYGQKLTLGTTGGSGTGEITYSVDATISTGEATIGADGVLTPVKVGSVVITATKAGDADYSKITSAPFVIMITPAIPTGEPKYTVITADGKTLADAALTLTGSTLTPAEGTLKWVDEAGNELSDDTEVKANTTYKWRFTPANDNYDTLTGEVELWHVEAPAISAQPKNVSVMTGEKATFEVTATGTDVTYQWQIDRNDGKGFVDINGATGATYTTGVTDKSCDGFKYQCVIRNAAGSVTTDTAVLTVKEKYIITASAGENGSISPNGAVEVVEGSNQTFVIAAEEGYEIESLTVDGTAVNADASYTFENVTAAHTIAVTFKQQYKIIEGANGSWTQNTDGSGSIKIRGNGGFSKFRNVMVDGNIIDPSNYTASEGSTIIELHEDYLKTLSEGIHTLAIVWTDGSASTNFTVARNTSGNEDTGNNDNDDSNNDNGGSTNTAGSSDNTAQTLTKSPKTGDASGLWIALFAASAAGLAVMLVRRKKY